MDNTLASFTDVLDDEFCDSQPISLTLSIEGNTALTDTNILDTICAISRPAKGTGKRGDLRSTEEIDVKYRDVFTYPYFNLIQSKVIDDALYSDKSIVVCAPTGSGKTVIFEMAIVQLLMELEDKNYTDDFKIIYMAPVKALCMERLTEWYPKFTKLGLLCIEATGDTDVDFSQLKPYKIIITTPEKWDMLTRRWRDHRNLVEVIKLFLIDEVHILNDEVRGPVLEAVVSRMKTIESSAQSVYRIEKLQNQLHGTEMTHKTAPSIRFVAVSATVSNPEDVANWLGTANKPAVFHKFGDECRPVKLRRVVEGYPCPEGTSIFKFDIILNYKLWPIIQKYHSGKPTLIFCNTRKSVALTAETLSRELTINFSAEQKAKLTALASTIKNKKLQSLVMAGVGCHHAGLLYEERLNIERAFRSRDLPILITTTTLAMGVNLPAHLVIIKNTQQYVNGAYQEYSISTILQMVGRAGRPQFDTEATAVIMTRLADKARYQALVGGCEPLQSYLHKRLPENLNSEAALGTVGDVAQCVQWLRSTFLYVRAARDPKKYLNLSHNSPQHLIANKIEELCVRAMNGLASAGLITMDDASCIESTEAGRLMSIYYLDLETMKQIMKIEGTESIDRLLTLICESHELADMHLRVDERRCLNALNRNNAAATIRFPMKGRITTRQMKLNCIIQAVLGCLAIPDPSLNQEAMKIMRVADRVCKCLVAYVTRPDLVSRQPQFYSAVLNSIILAKCITAHLWENSPFVSKQLKGIGPTFSTLLATAGKVNFMLLEESHPRDLERIMNKGPPAGNVLRKQISLLPKYQLCMTPIDENTVMLQLVLLNQNFLCENAEELTAGSSHKCYIIVGDSSNQLLLLTAFKDKDLLNVFDGSITREIRRKHAYGHNIFAHCISTTFVGLDTHAEYFFHDLNPYVRSPDYNKKEITTNTTVKSQTNITDTFKDRRRKSTTALNNIHSKEKKKRDNAIMENFKYLKETFETASKNIKDIVNKPLTNTCKLSTNTVVDITPEKEIILIDKDCTEFTKITSVINNVEETNSDDYLDDEKVDSILAEIENEMSKNKVNTMNTKCLPQTDIVGAVSSPEVQNASFSKTPNHLKPNYYNITGERKKRKLSAIKSNYTFIELLEKNISLSDDDEKSSEKNKISSNSNGFSETIKNQINSYIQNAATKVKPRDTNVQLLIEKEDKAQSKSIDLKDKIIVNLDNEKAHSFYPHYEIKEILSSRKGTKELENEKCMITGPEKCLFNEDNVKCYEQNVNNDNNITPVLDDTQNTPFYDNCNIQPNINETLGTGPHITEKENGQYIINHSNKSIIEKECDSNMSCIGKKPNGESNLLQKDLITVNSIWNKGSEMISSEIHLGNQNMYPDTIECNQSNSSLTKMGNKNEQSVVPFFHQDSHQICKPKLPEISINNAMKDYDKSRPYNQNKNKTNSPIRTSIIRPNNVPVLTNCSKSNINSSNDMNVFGKTHLAVCNSYYNEHTIVNGYAENYSYCATKIDIGLKQVPAYCVVKRVQMDLNIIKSICNDQYPQSNILKFGDKAKLDNEIAIKHDDQKPEYILPNLDRNMNMFKKIMYQEQIINNYLVEDQIIDSRKTCQNLNPKYKTKQIVSSAPNPENAQFNQDMKYNANLYNNETDTNENIEDNVRNGMEIEQIQDLNKPENGSTYVKTREKNDSTTETTSNTVQNILTKYSKILVKDNTGTQTPTRFIKNRNISCNKSPKSKLKPFKINDVQKVHATLPDSIIDSYKPLENNVPIAKLTHTKEMFNKYSPTERHGLVHNNNISLDEIVASQTSTDINFEPIQLPLEMDIEFDTDTKIDQTMFDPKTLLQCTVNHEEIIPPPPQFSDYSDIAKKNMISNIQNDESQFYANTVDTNLNYTENIFDDQSITHLTPTREIETWTLAEGECMENIYSSPSAGKSFTVMRRNTPSFSDLSANRPMSRQGKLGQFKFNQKAKLKNWIRSHIK